MDAEYFSVRAICKFEHILSVQACQMLCVSVIMQMYSGQTRVSVQFEIVVLSVNTFLCTKLLPEMER